jgi:O-succinylbenzoate synthase
VVFPAGAAPWPTVAAVELLRVKIPLLRPHVYAGGEERVRDVVLVRARDENDREGWGECSTLSAPGYAGGTTAEAWSILRDDLARQWLRGLPARGASPMAFAALEVAALDLVLRADGVSLGDRLAEELGPRRDTIAWCAVASPAEASVLTSEIDAALAAGARQVKLKISPRRDVEPLTLVRDRYPDLALAADANGSYPSVDAVPTELAHLDLSYLEQPLAADDLAGAARLATELGVAIALDESLTSAQRLEEAASFGVPFTVSVKVGRLGGVGEAARVLAEAARLGFDAFVGGMLETAVGRSVALAVAAQSACTLPCDAGPTARYFATDIGPSFVPDASGALHPPSAPGIGLIPDPAAIERFCVERVMVAA